MIVTIDKFGRVLIPKRLRDRLGLAPGAELSLDIHTGGDGAPTLEIRAVPDPDDPDGGLTYVDGVLIHDGKLAPEGQDIAAFIKAQREARALRLAGLDPDVR
ncbi:AbrB/MazE/SpoVT family DNA-binding domain-containing protein [Rubrivirga sp.]|uniref:AbrB/MazE/SpoVT family DNA-binding domain-containing protein n=1 Tax=Rubrivirga sp. TaxID=1885344 RepID=UPI003B52FADD